MVACHKDTEARLKIIPLAKSGTTWAPEYAYTVMNYKSLKNKTIHDSVLTIDS